MHLLSLALASDPLTPAPILTELAERATDTAVRFRLAAHPHLPDEFALPEPGAADDATALMRAGELDETLMTDLATPRTRARLLAVVDTATLVSYCDLPWESDTSDAVHELARRSLTRDPDANRALHRVLALRAATPTPRRLEAIAALLSDPGTRRSGDGDYVGAQLVAQAVRHPDHLRELADLTADPDLAATLVRYADLAAHEDVEARHRADVRTAAGLPPDGSGTAAGWGQAIAMSGDEDLAQQALVNAGPRRIIASHILRQLPLIDTAVRLRAMAIVSGVTTDAPVSSREQYELTTARHGDQQSAHDLASSVAPHVPHATTLVTAGWERAQADGAGDLHPIHVGRYALNPALPDAARAEAIAELVRRRAQLRSEDLATLLTLAEHAHRAADLHDTLLATPLPQLRELANCDPYLVRQIVWHLARALRPHHALLPSNVRAMTALEPTFTGSVSELLDTGEALHR